MDKDQKVYIKENDVNFRKQSEAIDGVQKMRVGQELVVVDGPWFRVMKDEQEGWVRADYLSEIVPISSSITAQQNELILGQPNLAASDVIKKIRETIKDTLNGAKNGYSLQCTEYVTYRVKTKLGIDIQWPVSSGRNGGVWWKIFQDARVYKILSEPKVNCAMCFTTGISKDQAVNDVGHVAFVEEALPDGTIKISEANWPNEGKYNERTITKDKWQNQ